MTAPGAPAPVGTMLRRVSGDLMSAMDSQLAQVVAMLDGLPRRGNADAVLAPLRPRLARLRPVRPLNFDRLLFTPLDGMIVSATAWQRDTPGLPRSALRPLADQVRGLLPHHSAEIDALLHGHRADDRALLLAAGSRLWPEAARALTLAPAPPDWVAVTGLREADYAALAGMLAALLGCATAIRAIEDEHRVGNPPDRPRLEALVNQVAPAGPLALATLLAILTERLPDTPAIGLIIDRMAVTEIDPRLRQAAEQAMAFVVARLEAAPPLPRDMAQAAQTVRNLADLLDDLQARARERPARLAQIKLARERIDAECRAAFTEALTEQILQPLGTLAAADDAAATQLEAAALALRRFDHAARRLNNAGHYDRALRACAPLVATRPGESAAAGTDRIRLAEILLGPVAARREW